MKAPFLARKLHKWIALIIGVQVLFWMVSGAYMATVHVDFIHGDSLVKNVNRPIDHNLPLLYSVSAVLEQFPGAIQVDLVSRLDEPHYIVTHESSTALLNAITGETVSPVGEDTAIELTEYYYAGEGVVSNAILLTDDSQKPYDELSKGDIVLPSNCGGGTCGLCVVSLSPDAAETLADLKVVPEHARRQGVRLYCQAEVTYDMSVVTSDKALSAESRIAEVMNSRFLTPLIREITLQVTDGDLNYHAGSYTHILIPPHDLSESDLDLSDEVTSSLNHRSSSIVSHTNTEIRRAYSLANVPEDNISEIVLNVRFMAPPIDGSDMLAGAGSSYMWSLQKGDVLDLVGPLGDFQTTSTDLDMIFIGDGAGMAPLRSIIRSELLYHSSKRRIDFWYGGRSRKDLFYVGEFDELETKFANFNWQPVLSEPQENDDWIGPTGFVHLTARDSLLTRNRDLSSCEFYICGPPPMLAATRQMITEFGVPESRVFFDDFGI